MRTRRLSEKIEALPAWKRRLVNTAATVSAILVLAAAMRPILRPVANSTLREVLDSTYVLQQNYDKDTFRDSLNHKQELDSIFRMIGADRAQHATMDSMARCIFRDKPEYCR